MTLPKSRRCGSVSNTHRFSAWSLSFLISGSLSSHFACNTITTNPSGAMPCDFPLSDLWDLFSRVFSRIGCHRCIWQCEGAHCCSYVPIAASRAKTIHTFLQPLSFIYMPSSIPQILPFQHNLGGQYTHLGKNLVGWASVHVPKRGVSRISTRITLWVNLSIIPDLFVDGYQDL